jgi:DNA-binding GntR family transcriptional regulator
MSSDQIAEDLTDRINSGEYRPGDQLPTYQALMRLYDVSYGTIARVITLMRERGVIVGVPGRGTFVRDD